MDASHFDGEAPQASRALPIIGFIITGIWILSVLIFILSNRADFSELAPNAIGDFAAGVFAPMAFLWLVLGFFQQGEELRNSGRALWLQGRELQHSVEQQRELVNVTREQLQFENRMLEQRREEISRNAQPMIKLSQGGSSPGGSGTRIYRFNVLNHGKPYTDITVDFHGAAASRSTDMLPTGGKFQFELELPTGKVEPFKASVNYLDERLLRGSKTFAVAGDNSRFEITEEP